MAKGEPPSIDGFSSQFPEDFPASPLQLPEGELSQVSAGGSSIPVTVPRQQSVKAMDSRKGLLTGAE